MSLLPIELLRRRMENELALCRERLPHRFETKGIHGFPAEVNVGLSDVSGYQLKETGEISRKNQHELKVIVTENYPYQRPIVRWQSEIFHPNIMPPEEGGYVCTKLLSDWGFTSTLYEFMKGLEVLVQMPDCEHPFGHEQCQRAAKELKRDKKSE